MIYLILIKIWRWFVFVIAVVSLLYAGIANSADFEQIPLPYKTEILCVLGVLIAIHFAILIYFGVDAGIVLMSMYLDDHYTVVIGNGDGRHPQTYDSATWRERQHEYDDLYDVRIYYNNPTGKPSVLKRLR
jgi:hypothetical protein